MVFDTARRQRPTAATGIAVPGSDATIPVTVAPRARRLTLKVDPALGAVRMVVPPGAHPDELARFVARHADWVRTRLAAVPPPRPFVEGAVVPVLGRDHTIRSAATGPAPVWRRDGVLWVTGRPEHIGRRVRDHLVAEARRELAARSHAVAARVDRRVASVTVRDTATRWGSCSATGRLSYSWRLILAPEMVVDYVVAHEAAHLVELNHSPRFWAVVDTLTAHKAAAKSWLKANGAGLHRFGRTPAH